MYGIAGRPFVAYPGLRCPRKSGNEIIRLNARTAHELNRETTAETGATVILIRFTRCPSLQSWLYRRLLLVTETGHHGVTAGDNFDLIEWPTNMIQVCCVDVDVFDKSGHPI